MSLIYTKNRYWNKKKPLKRIVGRKEQASIRRRKVNNFLLSFFDNTYEYQEKEINGFWITKNVVNGRLSPYLYTGESWQRSKGYHPGGKYEYRKASKPKYSYAKKEEWGKGEERSKPRKAVGVYNQFAKKKRGFPDKNQKAKIGEDYKKELGLN